MHLATLGSARLKLILPAFSWHHCHVNRTTLCTKPNNICFHHFVQPEILALYYLERLRREMPCRQGSFCKLRRGSSGAYSTVQTFTLGMARHRAEGVPEFGYFG